MQGGFIFSEDGSFYQFGEIKTARYLIASMIQVVNELNAQEEHILLQSVSTERLEQILSQRHEAQLEP